MGDDAGKSLETLACELVRAYYDDERAFRDVAWELARHFDREGRVGLAEFVLGQFGGPGTFTTMEIDSLSIIARNMFDRLAELEGKDSDEVREFGRRLSWYVHEYRATYGHSPDGFPSQEENNGKRQRCQQLEQLAREMYAAIAPMHVPCCEDTCCILADHGWPADTCLQYFREKLGELGVSQDG